MRLDGSITVAIRSRSSTYEHRCELERKQLGLLRQELGIDPPPEQHSSKEVKPEKGSEVA